GALDARRHDNGVGRLELLDGAAGPQAADAFDNDVELVADFLITPRLFLLGHEADELGREARAVEHRHPHRFGVEEVTRLGKAYEVHGIPALSYETNRPRLQPR